MPIKQAAKKHLRQTKKRTQSNRRVKSRIHAVTIKLRKELEDKKMSDAGATLRQAVQTLDKAAKSGVIKKNTAARKKSRLMKRLHQVQKKSA